MSNGKKARRKFGDRKDGRLVKVPGIQGIMAYVYPNRTDNEVYHYDELDVTELLDFLKKKNEAHPDYKTTVFHAMLTMMARTLKERPRLNRFVQGFRTYERDEISICFLMKKQFNDKAEESIMFLKARDDDTIDTISQRIYKEVSGNKKTKKSDTAVDKNLAWVFKMPFLILALFIRIVRFLDFWGLNPQFLMEGDSSYASLLIANLGSIGGKAIYHHLNNYGTNSIVFTMGTIRDREVKLPDGSTEVRKMMDIGVTIDERIGDGFYFIKSLRLLKHICENPELLDRELKISSGFDYDK